jgi:hypothetical protein
VGRTEAQVNGKARTMNVAPVVLMDTTFIPLRFVAEALGARVDWSPQTWQVTVNDNGHVGVLPVSRSGPQATPR